MIDEKDPNYEFSYEVVSSMRHMLSNANLGMDTLEYSADFTIKHTLTVLKCMNEAADMWFYSKSMPRTIFYAIFINTVHEYITDNQGKHQNRDFWFELVVKITKEWEKISEISKEVKKNDRINVDEYHEMFRRDLDVSTQ